MYCLSWNSYKNNICNGFAQLQQKEEFVDMTIVAEGHLVKVHKNLISLASPYIKNVIKAAPCPHPIIFLTNITHGVLCHLLEYIYTGEVHVEMEKLNDFIKAAKELQLSGIANDLSPAVNLTSAQRDNAAESLPIEEQINIQKRPFEFRPSDAPIGSDNGHIFHINIPPSQNANNNNNTLPLGESLSSGNVSNANKIQILENRRLECSTNISDAAKQSNADDNVLNIDMEISDNPSKNHSLPLSVTSLVNGQNTNTSETLPIVADIQLFGNRLNDYATSDAAVITNNMHNLIDTNVKISSRNDDSNHYDYSHSVNVTNMEGADDFEEFLKFPDPPNSTTEGNSVTSEQTQKLKVMDPDNQEVQHEFSVALGSEILPQQYTVSNRGSVQMLLNRYLYSMHHSANGGAKRRWRCIDYRYLRCGAYVDTLDDKIIKRFSKNENQKLNWGNAVPGKISKSSVVCSAYFKCDDFIPGYTRKMLKPDAVPSIFPKVVTRALRKEFWVRGAIIFTEIERAKRFEQSFGKSVFEKKLLNV